MASTTDQNFEQLSYSGPGLSQHKAAARIEYEDCVLEFLEYVVEPAELLSEQVQFRFDNGEFPRRGLRVRWRHVAAGDAIDVLAQSREVLKHEIREPDAKKDRGNQHTAGNQGNVADPRINQVPQEHRRNQHLDDKDGLRFLRYADRKA